MQLHTELVQDGNNTGIRVPEDDVLSFGAGKRPPVVVTFNGYTYRSTIAPMGGEYWIPVSAAVRANSGAKGGDMLDVVIELDTAPRIVDVPEDLATALAAHPAALAAYDALSPSRKKAIVTNVTGTKQAETRARRIAKAIAELGG